ncbi:MAG TPA: MBL fold metallo-hydrolase [Pyrinomonadaceae bacterium]|nr:MBL fold metallo-hydrolase [Pyrinomonadaceae bacterium]
MQSPKVTTPRDAAAVILLRHNTNPTEPEVYWVRRSEKLAFLGGFHAFPGGQLDQPDTLIPVDNSPDAETAAAISCAARELFEELGVLLARGGDLLTRGQRASLLDDLQSGRMTWPDLLKHYDLHLDARDYSFAGRWVTPPFSARRFDTWFFLACCPPRQEPQIIPGELDFGEWISARSAFQRWIQGKVVAVPPTLHALKTLSGGLTPDLTERFLSIPQAHRGLVRSIEFRPNYICVPVRTPTKPPATHTNAYLVYTTREVLVIDPASPYAEEQRSLAECVDELTRDGRRVRGVLLTHLHPDHVGGVNALREHLGGAAVCAHRLTAEALAGSITIDRIIEDEDLVQLDGEPSITLRALHTPGHARGHLCLYEESTGTLISGDNIVGLGSVLIDPPEGNMQQYLDSLRRMRSLQNLSIILGGHGPAIANPQAKLDEYINHRLEREAAILAAVRNGAATPQEIVRVVYTDVSPKAYSMAERAVLAHLQKLSEEGMVGGVKIDD